MSQCTKDQEVVSATIGNTKPKIVVCAAIRNSYGLIICGPRHFDETMHRLLSVSETSGGDWADAEQGFIDQYGTFLTREEAWIVAEKAGQIKYRVGGDGKKLYSENLY